MSPGLDSANGASSLLRYARVLALYFLFMAVCWAIGIEGVYGHPTPFYALWAPIAELSPAFGFHLLLVVATAALYLVYLQRRLPAVLEPAFAWSPAQRRRYLAALVVFGFGLACAIAMLRGGADGISQAYARSAYEFAGDIGKAPSISALFTNYEKIRPYLSMHAKVHPPGPIAYLWLLSYVVTQDPLALSLATVLLGALAVVPLFFWSRTLLDEPTAAVAAAVYAVVPSILLFNATSADALFPVVTLSGLWAFDRALRAPEVLAVTGFSLFAGFGFFLMTILKFSLVGMGVYFALAGLLGLSRAGLRRNVFLCAGVMFCAFLACHLALRLATHFDIVAIFHAAKAQFDEDQHNLDLQTPRYPGWVYRILNPLCWFYFAGIPVSLLFLRRLRRPEAATRGLFLVFLFTAIALNFLYLARGEGERSALYLFPFLVLPAAHLLLTQCRDAGTLAPARTAIGFLLFQTILTELLFYTYW